MRIYASTFIKSTPLHFLCNCTIIFCYIASVQSNIREKEMNIGLLEIQLKWTSFFDAKWIIFWLISTISSFIISDRLILLQFNHYLNLL